jgi:preprotein translocase subunit SecE
MQNDVNSKDSHPSVMFSESQERGIVGLLCFLAAIHVWIFSAAFPFFNVVDEQMHFDVVVRYSQGRIPCTLDSSCPEAMPYILLYSSLEYLWAPDTFWNGRIPSPPWRQPLDKIAPFFAARKANWEKIKNCEVSQPPLYYAVAGGWWWMGKQCGLHDEYLLYWLRFLNAFFVCAMVWLGSAAARLVCPGRSFLRLGVPALLAFFPQTVFYSIQNDVLLPLCFGAAFILLVRLSRAEIPGVRLGMATGLALAATFLTKINSLPLLAVSAVFVLLTTWHLIKMGKIRAALPALAALMLCAVLPMAAWLGWCKYHFGDFTGTAVKIQFLGWTHKPFSEWWQHPIFTPHGFWTFLSRLLASFWQSDFLWHGRPLSSPVVNAVYAVSSVGFVGMSVVVLLSRSPGATAPQRQALWLGFWSIVSAVAFLGFLSLIFDFHNCIFPSRDHPYFTSGRLMLGSLIPFMLLFLYGLDQGLSRIKNNWVKPLVLIGMILFMLISEIIINRPVFSSQYNWFHL